MHSSAPAWTIVSHRAAPVARSLGTSLDAAAELGAAGRAGEAEPAMELGIVLMGDEDLGDVALGREAQRHCAPYAERR